MSVTTELLSLSMAILSTQVIDNVNCKSKGSIILSTDSASDIYVKGTITNNGLIYCYSNNTVYDSSNQPFNKPIVTPVGPVNIFTGGEFLRLSPIV